MLFNDVHRSVTGTAEWGGGGGGEGALAYK